MEGDVVRTRASCGAEVPGRRKGGFQSQAGHARCAVPGVAPLRQGRTCSPTTSSDIPSSLHMPTIDSCLWRCSDHSPAAVDVKVDFLRPTIDTIQQSLQSAWAQLPPPVQQVGLPFRNRYWRCP